MRFRSLILIAVLIIIISILLAIALDALASTPPVVQTNDATNIQSSSARLNGNLIDLGMEDIGIPPTRVQGPSVAVGVGFSIVASINTASSNFILIIVGGCQIYDGTLNSVTTSPVDTVKQLNFSGKQVPGGEGNISDAFYVTNPQSSPTYQVTAAWSASSCSYGEKYVALYTFSGVNVTAPMVNNGNTTQDNFNGFSPFTTSFANPASHQLAIFTEVTTDQDQAFRDIHLVNMTGLTNSWTYGSSANCAGAAWCPAGGFGISRTAVTFTANNIDFAATSWFINGTITQSPRTSVDVYFEYGNTPSLGSNTTHVTKTSPTLYSDSISGLTPGNTYYFRFCATPTTNCGAILSFFVSLVDFGDIGRVMLFFSLLFFILLGAYWLKRKWRNDE